MKKRDWQNTPFIAVMMMLVAVAATLLFTEAPEYVPDPAEPLWGEWVAVSSPEMGSTEVQGFTLTKTGQLVSQKGPRLSYTYDPNTKVVSVDGSEAISSLQYTMRYDCTALVSTDRRVYVQTGDYNKARTAYSEELSVNTGQYISFLGTWIPLTENDVSNILFRGKSLTLNCDLRADVSDMDGTIPFARSDDSNNVIYLYPEGNRKDGIYYQLKTYLGFTVLRGNGITYVKESDFADANAAHTRLLSVTGDWVCWTKGVQDVYSTSKVNYLGQRLSLSANQIFTDEDGNLIPFTFMPNTQVIGFQNKVSSILKYTEEYGFPMLYNSYDYSNFAYPFVYVREEDLDAAHQIYLQQVQDYIVWRQEQYQACAKWLKMRQTEIGLNAVLTDSGKWSVTVTDAAIRETANQYRFSISIEVTNLSTGTLLLDKAVNEIYLSMSTDQPLGTEIDYVFDMIRFQPDTVLDSTGAEPQKVQVAPGGIVTLQITYTQGKLDACAKYESITDPALQDYFAHFVFGDTKYVIQLQEAFLAK